MKPLSPRGRALIDVVREVDRPSSQDRARIRAALTAQLGVAILPSSSSLSGAAPPTSVPAPAVAPAPVLPPAPLPPIPMLGGLGLKLMAAGALIGAVGIGAGVASSRPSSPAITAAARPSAPAAPRAALDEGTSTPASQATAVEATDAPSPDPRTLEEETGSPGKLESARASAAALPRAGEKAGRGKPPVDRALAHAKETSLPPAAADAPPVGFVSPSHASSLMEETALLRQAQAALKEGDAQKSLAAVDALAARHPQGMLREERLAARVLALCAAGRVEEARVEGQRFVAEMPRSILAERVRASCAFGPPHGR